LRDSTFSHFDKIPACDRRTDGQTSGRTRDESIYRASIASRGKTDEARISELDIEMFHHEFCKFIYFGVKRSKVKVTSHNNVCGVELWILVSAGFFWFKTRLQ